MEVEDLLDSVGSVVARDPLLLGDTVAFRELLVVLRLEVVAHLEGLLRLENPEVTGLGELGVGLVHLGHLFPSVEDRILFKNILLVEHGDAEGIGLVPAVVHDLRRAHLLVLLIVAVGRAIIGRAVAHEVEIL